MSTLSTVKNSAKSYSSGMGESAVVMSGSVVALSIKLEAATRKKGKIWLAWCPPLDVTTQADTKQRALASLKQAVELWFESCIARNVLEEALLEAGFSKMKPGEMLPQNANVIKLHEPPPAHAFPAPRDYIEVSIRIYRRTTQRGQSACVQLTGRN